MLMVSDQQTVRLTLDLELDGNGVMENFSGDFNGRSRIGTGAIHSRERRLIQDGVPR